MSDTVHEGVSARKTLEATLIAKAMKDDGYRARLLDDPRAALAEAQVPRDIEGWHPAVVLSLSDSEARIGIEGVDEDSDGHWIPAKDVQWARKRLADGKLGRQARVASDLVDVGDVVLVRQMTSDSDGSFIRWTLRQVPEIEGGFMAMDVNTGRVIAMQGGFSYQSSVFNRATQAQRQPGSSFKPFVYAAALDSGFTPATIVVDEPITLNTPQGLWTPKNASGKFYGPTPMRTGIEQSRNLMTIRIAQDIGMDTVAKYAEKFGVYDHLGNFLANSLGAQETTLFKMVAAYAMFANGGERVEPTLVDRVQDRYGRTIYRHDRSVCENCDQATLPAGASLRLEPWEYEAGGYFAKLSHWLTHNMARFGFYRPFADDQGGVAIEPWHLSHGADSIRMAALLTPETLSQALSHSTLAGKACILEQLPLLWQQFIAPTLPSGTAL